MAATSLSRNPFADPALPSFADLIARIGAASEPPLRTRQNWAWALRTVARACHKELAEIPVHPEFLRPLLDKATPIAIGLGTPAWNNARSLLGKVLEWAGMASMPAHYQAPFAPVWAELWDKLPAGKNAMRFQLSRLFHYCSAQRIAPAEISDEILAGFHAALIAESIVEQPYQIYRGAAKSWNNAAERIPGWPQRLLCVPSRQQRVTLEWNDFPPTLEADVSAYLRRAALLDLTDDHFTRAQRPATLETRGWQLRLLASAIAKSGTDAASLIDLRAMLEPKTAAEGLQYLRARNSGQSSVQISNLATFLPTLALRLNMDPKIITDLRKVALKLKVIQHGMTPRNRQALRAFDDPDAVDALVNLPRRMLRAVQASGRKGHREARLVQTALAIELLLNAPVRIRNLASIDITRHFIETGKGPNRRVHIRFPAAEVKNASDLEFPLMPETVELLDVYLSVWRPLLCPEETPFLFPGDTPGKHKGKATLSAQIKEIVFARTRLDMPAHRFRHVVAKIYLDRNPGQYEVVRLLLGHKDIQTTITFYAGAETAAAARHYARTILDLRDHDRLLPARAVRR